MLVCDTAISDINIKGFIHQDSIPDEWYTTTVKHDNNVYWQKGYEVREPDETYINISSKLGYPNQMWWKPTEYLDADKKPLPKSIFIWMSISNTH
jgi:hypothetical protein